MLTSSQITDARRFAGYPLVGDTNVGDQRDMAYSWVSPGVMQTLFHRLNSLSVDEETILINKYLTPLNLLEDAVTGSSDNLDTDQAAVWTHNKNEVHDRTALFNQKRIDMCGFLGMATGPSLSSGIVKVNRG